MIPEVEQRHTPDWLRKITGLEHFPSRDVLKNSLYYPSSGRDGDPVKYLAGLVHSFIYVDYGIEHDAVMESLQDERHKFRGYDIIGCRDVLQEELTPEGWQPLLPDVSRDGDPTRYLGHIKKPFAIWSVHERLQGFDEEHGPSRFSLLYLCADGAAAFQALYHGNECAPEVVAIIQPGTGVGQNYTDFRNPDQILGRSVLQNPYGKPRYLLYGGWGRDYKTSCWPEYSRLIHYWPAAGGDLGLWRMEQT